MSVTIENIEDAFVSKIQTALTGEGDVKTCVGDPESYTDSDSFPLILVSCQQFSPVEIYYPGDIVISVFFIGNNNRTAQTQLRAFMKTVFNTLYGSTLDLKIQGTVKPVPPFTLYDVTPDIIIYKQDYTCGVCD